MDHEIMMGWLLLWSQLHSKNQSTRTGVSDSGPDKITLASGTLLGTDMGFTSIISCTFSHLLFSTPLRIFTAQQ